MANIRKVILTAGEPAVIEKVRNALLRYCNVPGRCISINVLETRVSWEWVELQYLGDDTAEQVQLWRGWANGYMCANVFHPANACER